MSALEQQVIDAVAGRVIEHLEARAGGHCVQISNLPARVADLACEQTHAVLDAKGDFARLVVQRDPEKPWHATPTKIIELRNHVDERDSQLAVFIPAGEHLAVEDSFGESTFEILDVGDLYRSIAEELSDRLERQAPAIAERADAIVAILRGDDRFATSDEAIAGYLAHIVGQPTMEELGHALTEVRLLPDRDLGEFDSAELQSRLIRNAQQVAALTEAAAPVERLRALPLDPRVAQNQSILDALGNAIGDGTLDPVELARRLGDPAVREHVDFSRWRIDAVASRPEEFRVLQLVGDLTRDADPTLTKAISSVGVKFRCKPAPDRIDGLGFLTLEVVRIGERAGEAFETGYEATKRKLPKSSDSQWKLKIDAEAIDDRDGAFCFRLRAWNDDNTLVEEALSPHFRVGNEPPDVEPEITSATSVAAARVLAWGASSELEPQTLRTPDLTLDKRAKGEEAKKIASVIVRFGHGSMPAEIRLSRILAGLERETLSDPDQLGRYDIELGDSEIANALTPGGMPSEQFLEQRSQLFSLLREHQLALADDESPGSVIALADLARLTEEVAAYARSWTQALREATDSGSLGATLCVDQVSVFDQGREIGRLVGPTHPLRLLWLARYQQLLEDWVLNTGSDALEARELGLVLGTLTPRNLPHVVITEGIGALRQIQAIDLYWSIYGSPASADAAALAARVRSWLRMEQTSMATVSVGDLVLRIRRYLVAHPYADHLIVNFVEPGIGHVIVETLLRLQEESGTEHLRYTIRLFSAELSRDELGRALDDFMADAEASRTARKSAADAFLASVEDTLAPKLTYSKHELRDLVAAPDGYPGHLTFFLDSFDLTTVAAAPISDRRSFFGSSLIIDPAVVFRRSDQALDPQWDEHIVSDPDSTDEFVSAYAVAEHATARMLGAEDESFVPAVRLQLDRVRRAVLDAVHKSSDWVIVVDPVFSDEYLDAPPAEGETARFLIDYSAPMTLEGGRRVVVSTRSRAELRNLLQPLIRQHELDVPDDRVETLLDGLQLLGSGLGLRLLNNRTQALEALSLALGSLYLAEQGVLRRAIAIPLDLHQDLVHEEQRQSAGNDASLDRTDLAVVQIDATTRHFGVHLVELKARSGGAGGSELLDKVRKQLENSHKVLRSRLFGADLRERPGSLAAALQVRRLSKLLSHYLERAARYGLVEPLALAECRRLAADLDGPYTVGFDKHALIFEMDGVSALPQRHDGVRVVRIGREDIRELLLRTRTPLETVVVQTAETLEGVFGAGEEVRETVAEVGESGRSATYTGDEQRQPTRTGAVEADDGPAVGPSDAGADGPHPDDVEIIGTAPTAAQFGIVGTLPSSDRPVAVDLDGTNVISVFGVQGSGKSYTVGTLLEAALIEGSPINRLPRPLGGIVFHYDTDLTYAPEFATMGAENDDAAAVEELRNRFGADTAAVSDVVVLAPADLVRARREEFPGLMVEPLVLGPDELNLNDWRLLMGLEGGEQMYARSMNNLFRRLRNEVSIESLRESVAESSMSRNQKNLAEARIDFAESFVRDEGGVAHLLRPGRLVIVDIRDELMAQDEALAIFMVLLNRFGQVAEGASPFNKIIVFDEAHKYMGNTRLTQAIVDNIRLMRHRGTTVVLASQDPPSVPKEVVELSSIVIAHRFTSPKWLDHIRKVNSAFGEAAMQPSQLARLGAGEAFVWSVGGAEEFRRPQRVVMRPRLTRHGGATRRAT
jgi:hypothetical protein